jgi:hypothetical protein
MTIRSAIRGGEIDILNVLPEECAFKTMPDETDNKLFYGVELEVDCQAAYDMYDFNRDYAATCNGTKKVDFNAYNKVLRDFQTALATDLEDLSILKCDGHAEIVTIPATLRFHKEVLWKSWIENSMKQCMKAKRNGLHIHFSRNALKDLQLAKALLFVHEEKNSAFLSKIAGRDVTRSAHWCRQRSGVELAIMKAAKTARGVLEVTSVSRDAISLSRRTGTTVEVRIFASDPTEQGVFQALEFVDALITFCAHNGTLREEIHYTAFIDWFINANKHVRYPYLAANLERLGYVQKTTKKKVA